MQTQSWMMILAAVCAALVHFCSSAVESHSAQADQISSLPGQPRVSFQQFSGYITIDEKQDRSFFYYFVEAENDTTALKPLVVWFSGGPGCSSVRGGAFGQHGPFRPSGDILLTNKYSWNREANMLYPESPAGTGFSYSANTSFYTNLNDEITARDNLVFLKNWFIKFPQYKNSELFIAGESYAGHFVPQLAQLILESRVKFNLKGILMGNPLMDFDTNYNSVPHFYWSHGLISDSTYNLFSSKCNYSRMNREQTSGSLSPACLAVRSQYSQEVGDTVDRSDVTLNSCLPTVDPQPQVTENVDVCIRDEVNKYLNREDVQKSLHARLVGVANWSMCGGALRYNIKDKEITMIPVMGSLVKSGIRTFVYSGDQDSIIPLFGTRTLVDGLAKELRLNTTVPYRNWFEGEQVGGWTQVYGDILSFATVRGGSHTVPGTQPARALVLFTAFLKGQPPPAE
ncbi:serine carboxypeptidase-like 45 [Vitis riparia]|uniref:serine carboxypeptidase-like 45 n=1 Tax=Vitis riparia TaxID=96939 RepID=UPI00155AC62A|nr:serine carboxypeptidase-like 45 [Vitis riparia]